MFTDCGFYFPLESDDDPLTILTEGDERMLTLPSTNCSINATSSMYLDCGRLRAIDERSLNSKFSLNHWIADSHTLKVSCWKDILKPIQWVKSEVVMFSKQRRKTEKMNHNYIQKHATVVTKGSIKIGFALWKTGNNCQRRAVTRMEGTCLPNRKKS